MLDIRVLNSYENLIEDEEGNIPGKKLLMLGTMIVILGSLLSTDVFAGHRSHSSHSSHRSHSSHSSGSHGNSHSNHGSHSSHESHQSHSSHSNTSSHSNSQYSSEGDISYSAPATSRVPGVEDQTISATTDTFKLPAVNQNVAIPNGTPTSSIMPSLAVPASSIDTEIDASELHIPPSTDEI
ncbi:MAG: zinc transporter 7 [Clostridia bacterium]|nr:zinc transporter 7 [Clostridia bacterium]